VHVKFWKYVILCFCNCCQPRFQGNGKLPLPLHDEHVLNLAPTLHSKFHPIFLHHQSRNHFNLLLPHKNFSI
jgi:hypothetical protein